MTTIDRGGPVTHTRATELAALLAQIVALVAEDNLTAAIPEPRSTPERVLLTVAEAAAQLNLGKTKTYELVTSGEIDSVNIGRLRRIHIDSVRVYAARLVAGRKTDRQG